MDPVEPYTYRKCTAFKERLDIVNKLNETIDQVNTNTDDIEKLDDFVNSEFIPCTEFEDLENIIEIDNGIYKVKKDFIVYLKIDEEHGTTHIFTFYHPKNTRYYKDQFVWINANPEDQDPWDMWFQTFNVWNKNLNCENITTNDQNIVCDFVTEFGEEDKTFMVCYKG